MFMTLGLGHTDSPRQIEDYVKAGAREFFLGYVPQEWLDKYGWEVNPNRRPLGGNANYGLASEVRDVIAAIHDNGGLVNVAVNAHDNGRDRMGMIHDMFDLFETYKPDGYIIADPAIMYCMKKWGIERPIHLSTGVGCFNGEAVRFFCEQFNINRLVIPRKLTLMEMKDLIGDLKDLQLQFEVMVVGYRCLFNDEDCHSIHTAARPTMCSLVTHAQFHSMNRMPGNWKQVLENVVNTDIDPFDEKSELNQFLQEWHKEKPRKLKLTSWADADAGLAANLADMNLGNCGLCALKTLREIGVDVLKIPLRGSEEVKLHIVQMYSKVMNGEDQSPEFCRSLVNSPAFCAEPSSCYYELPGGVK